ncbi:hypothetical protein LCGC14_1204510 [marine sediment metagenome]|uniref:Methyltransferase FkbM domain-containing protein n=1 Tax=marine sediment metagenome TaxID=412755 RepID=A0A0F9LFY2_9ZZZZ
MDWGLESWKNLEIMYGRLNYTDKVVLDIGADWGGTPAFFLSKGARRVIGVDYHAWYVEKMADHFRDDCRVFPVQVNVKTSKQMENLIQIYKPDIVKVDCEGCERLLFDVNNLALCPEYVVEVHSDDVHHSLLSKFKEAGHTVAYQKKLADGLYITHWRMEE